MSYDPLHTPGSTVPIPGPLDRELWLARNFLDEVAKANIHSSSAMIEAAAGLDYRLRALVAALDAERGGQSSTGLPAPVRDLLAAVLDAIDLPHPAAAGGTEAHDQLLNTRAVHARIALRNLLEDGPDLGPAWNAKYLRERLAEHPIAGYVTVDQAHAALDEGKTWSEAVTLPSRGSSERPAHGERDRYSCNGRGAASMSAPRTVTVHTGDHGPVTIPEPHWATWTTPSVAYRSDICHHGQEQALVVGTPCCGEARIAAAQLMQWPFSVQDTQVRAAVEFDNDHEFDAASLAGLLDALVVWAVGPMHALHEELQRLEGGAS